MRRQKNHPRKLQSAGGHLKCDGGVEEPENAWDQSVVNLQESDRRAGAPNRIKK
jgi:hypothetical protein